jgi:hypothetical protein
VQVASPLMPTQCSEHAAAFRAGIPALREEAVTVTDCEVERGSVSSARGSASGVGAVPVEDAAASAHAAIRGGGCFGWLSFEGGTRLAG